MIQTMLEMHFEKIIFSMEIKYNPIDFERSSGFKNDPLNPFSRRL